MKDSSRRGFLQSSAVVGIIGLTGCSQITGGNDIQDTDGDGVIDSEDYAPRDASVQDASDVQEADSTDPEPQTPDEPTDQPSAGTPQTDTTVFDFEDGNLDRAWRNEIDISTNRSGIDGGRRAYTVQSNNAPEGDYALRGDPSLAGDGTSSILRDDFPPISADGATVSLYVKLGPVQSGGERANQVEFLERGQEDSGKRNGYHPVIVLDHKDRGNVSRTLISNPELPNTDLSSVKLVQFQNIDFSTNLIGSVRVGGEEVATSLSLFQDASEISAVRVKQGHFGQPANIVVDEISFTPGR
jgi:hypothetical protein